MTLAMGWAARSRLRSRPDSEADTLVHPIATLVIGVVGVAFFAGIAVISNTVGKNHTTTLGFVAFALLSGSMVAEYFFVRHRVSDDGMDCGRLFGRRIAFAWRDVNRVRYATGMKWFAIDLRSGVTVRISAMLTGLPAFARTLLAQVPRGAIDDDAHALLRETERGRPPSVWN